MQIAMVGLGKMGFNMATRLLRAGHEVVAYDLTADNVVRLIKEGAVGAATFKQLAEKLKNPRIVWTMVPAGQATEAVILELNDVLEKGDIVIDGGNSFYQDDIRHAKLLHTKGIHFIDAGTSGGVWGVDRGYCLMIGGEKESFDHCEPIFRSLAPGHGSIERTPGRGNRTGSSEEGYLHCGPVGAGHFVKMIHNGIEYGIMEAYAEGLNILKNVSNADIPVERRYNIDLAEVAEVWRRGSVVGSWLLDLTAMALAESPSLREYSGYVQDSGEGRWTVNAAVEEGVPAYVLSSALYARFRSRETDSFANKVLSAMRFKFGGHVELKSGD